MNRLMGIIWLHSPEAPVNGRPTLGQKSLSGAERQLIQRAENEVVPRVKQGPVVIEIKVSRVDSAGLSLPIQSGL
jgi:hypothetical protein